MGINVTGDFDPWAYLMIVVAVIMMGAFCIYALGVFFPEFRFW